MAGLPDLMPTNIEAYRYATLLTELLECAETTENRELLENFEELCFLAEGLMDEIKEQEKARGLDFVPAQSALGLSAMVLYDSLRRIMAKKLPVTNREVMRKAFWLN